MIDTRDDLTEAGSRSKGNAAIRLTLAIAVFGYLLLTSRAEPLPFDAEHFYFPMVRRLMEEGFAYLLSTESVRSTPVSYFWPAHFGIDPASIRFAHVLAGMALCLLAFDTARRLFSPWAGAIAAWALALSPLLRPHIAQPLASRGLHGRADSIEADRLA